MAATDRHAAFRTRRDTAEILSAYIDKISERHRRPSIVSQSSSRRGSTTYCRRSLSHPVISESDIFVGRLERRRSAVTFPSTFRTLSSVASYPCRVKSSTSSLSTSSHSPELCCYRSKGVRGSDWSILGHYFRQPKDEKKLTINQIRIRKSLEYVSFTVF